MWTAIGSAPFEVQTLIARPPAIREPLLTPP